MFLVKALVKALVMRKADGFLDEFHVCEYSIPLGNESTFFTKIRLRRAIWSLVFVFYSMNTEENIGRITSDADHVTTINHASFDTGITET